jgi:hypothetical protein
MADSFWLRDMIVLGQGAPNSIRKIGGQQGRCLCVWSKEKGYCRVYPVPYGYVKDWQIADFEVRMPSNDGRENSFVIFNYENEWENLSKRIHVHKIKNRLGNIVPVELNREQCLEMARKLAKDSFSDIRDSNHSFGLIKPVSFKLLFKKNKDKSEAQVKLANFDIELLDNLIMNQKDYAWIPVIEYACSMKCESKHPHTSKLVEWGAYLWMKQKPNDYAHCGKLIDNFHLNDSNYEHYILIGNMRQYTKTYVVVKLIRFKVK